MPDSAQRAINVYWWENDIIDFALDPARFLAVTDEGSSIEHRLAKANGLSYGCPPRHWAWS